MTSSSPLRTLATSSPRTAAWLLIALWVLSYAAVKAAGLQGLDVDSAEQVYFAQSWQWGYGTRQPPLYTWMLKALQPQAWSWTGALEVMRYGLLLGWLASVQVLARACGAGPALQAACLLAHLGLGLAMWRVHDSLTHTVLAVVLVTAGSAAVVRAITGSPRWWLVAGLLAGLACLAKFNALLWWLSAGAAAWGLAGRGATDLRRTLAWSLRGALVSAAVVLPYALWWWGQRTGAGALVRQIAVSSDAAPWWRPALDVAAGAVEFLALAPLLLALLGLACTWRARGSSGAPVSAGAGLNRLALQWLIAQNLLALAATMLVVTVAQGSEFKARWLWPVLPGLAVAVVLMSGAAVMRGAGAWPRRWYAVAVVVALGAVLVSLLRWWEPGLNARRCRECWTDRPALDVAQALRQAHGHAAGATLRVLAGDPHLAGILAGSDAAMLTFAPGMRTVPPPRGYAASPAPCVAAWISIDRPQPPPAALSSVLPAPGPSAVSSRSWPLRHAPGRRVWLQSFSVPAQACAVQAR